MEVLFKTIEKKVDQFQLLKWFEKSPFFLWILLVLVLNYASFNLNGNEEQYLLYAKQYMNPNWIQSNALNEFAGTRLLYQLLVGSVLKVLNFEQTLFVFRLFLCLLAAFPLAKLYSYIGFKKYEALLHLGVIFLPVQSLMGGSWMLISVEPKGFSYCLVLFALYYFLANKWRFMLLFLVSATYFHILVGVYTSFFFLMTLFLQGDRNQKYKVLKGAILYGLLILPFIWYLMPAVRITQEYSPSTSWIYTYFRSPHHTAIFKNLDYFFKQHFMGLMYCLMGLLYGMLVQSKLSLKAMKRANLLLILSLLWVLLATVVASFDKEGLFLKYYPFRINTLSTFLLGLSVIWFAFRSIKDQLKEYWGLFAIGLVVIFSIKPVASNIKSIYSYMKKDTNQTLEEICNYVKKETPRDAVVLSFLGDLSLTRRMERDRFVVYKFIPAVMEEIPDWYEREVFKRKLKTNIQLLKSKENIYKIDYVLTKVPIENEGLKLVKQNNSFFLYQLR